MEKIFRALFCTDDQKVEYATYMLVDAVDDWWYYARALLHQELGEGVPITWGHFKQAFLDSFFSQEFQEVRARQFDELVQGTMTVERYAAIFVELSRFASYLIPDEVKKAVKFERGLHPRIQSCLIPLKIRNFTDLVTRATLVEEDMRANAELFNKKKLDEGVPITWGRFKPVFLDCFFSQELQEARTRQFDELVQWTMTVEHYVATFVELSRFASYLIPDEVKKAAKFER
ncbi:uncharacterized protein LOC121243278 [Juglans microcarpa x Juglans regia]|uniref:uncharacterized protein LOC121243278 n=1 Tax=Juglans microcarpa x Juglans regia TaxID=2249226 RepID=UPI001B7D9BA2|nr:uncharacterized protein LOC121243278 [Juglans microcarpa x Juglans regia]